MKKQCSDLMLIEAQLEALQYFLKNADFGHLRGSCKELSGVDEMKVALEIPENHRDLTILLPGRVIKPEWKKS